MNLQTLHDNTGSQIGVFIPISDWKELKKQFADLETYETIGSTRVSMAIADSIVEGTDDIPEIRINSAEQQIHEAAYSPWTSDEEYKLKVMYFEGKPVKDIATSLKRNKGAITSRLRKMGINHTL